MNFKMTLIALLIKLCNIFIRFVQKKISICYDENGVTIRILERMQ